ncbi:hypothetical protein, partial [Escherichia coli]|uniref:hypothetical protein n=1 Tax=Escherichia coli TaxID=562 RepID=UPI001BDC470E
VVRRLRFSVPKTSIICSPISSLKTSIKTISFLSDIGCLDIQGASPFHYIVVLSFFSLAFTASNCQCLY